MDEKKKRTKLACDNCNSKRTKCDGQNPCFLCFRLQIPCTFTRKIGKRGPKAGYTEMLETRVRLLESVLTPEQWKVVGNLIPDEDQSPTQSYNVLSHLEDHLMTKDTSEPFNAQKRQRFDTLFQAGTHAPTTSEYFSGNLSGNESLNLRNDGLISPTIAFQAEKRQTMLVEELADLGHSSAGLSDESSVDDFNLPFEMISSFFSHVHQKIPIFCEQQFMPQISSQKRYLIFAMAALGAVNVVKKEEMTLFSVKKDRCKDGEAYYEKAVKGIQKEDPNLLDHDAVATFFLLFKYAKGSGRITEGFQYFVRAVKLLFRLKLNEDLVFMPRVDASSALVPFSELTRETRRRIFWIIYEYDIYLSFILAKPRIIQSDRIHVALPADDNVWPMIASLEKKYGTGYFSKGITGEPVLKTNPLQFPFASSNGNSPAYFGILLRLVTIFGQITDYNLRNSHNEKELELLHHALTDWKKTFDHWNSELSVYSTNLLASNATPPWMAAFFLLLYYFSIICIHRPILLSKARILGQNVFTDPSFEQCHSAASASSSITLQMHNTTLDFKYAPSFTHTIFFHMGIVYSMFASLLPKSSSRTTYLQHVDIYNTALDNLSIYFSPSKAKLNVLKHLQAFVSMQKNHAIEMKLFMESCTTGYPSFEAVMNDDMVRQYEASRISYHDESTKD